MNEQELLDLKEKVDNAKTTVSEFKGQLTALMKQLKDDWDCSDIKMAEIKLKSMEVSITALEKKIEKGVEELEDKYNIE